MNTVEAGYTRFDLQPLNASGGRGKYFSSFKISEYDWLLNPFITIVVGNLSLPIVEELHYNSLLTLR
jgi:hypothetical protein